LTIRGPFAIGLIVVVFLSLAANLVVAGFVVTRFIGPRPGGDIERIVAIGIRAFPPEIRDAIMKQADSKRGEMRARLDDIQAARQRMFEAMRATPFDRAALEAAYADVRTRTNELQQAGQEIMLDAVANASPAVRSQIRPPRGPFP
jgi:uncharacterized membrane protein